MRHRWSALASWLRQGDLLLVTSLLVVTLLLWAFIGISKEMREGEILSWDRSILLALRRPESPSLPVGPHWLPGFAQEVTALGSWSIITLVVVATVGLLLLERRWGAAAGVALAVVSGAVTMTLLKDVFSRERPDVALHLVEVTAQSYPSGHATISALTYATLGALGARVVSRRVVKVYLLVISVAMAILVGLTRVYLGVHYPSDVAAGWSLGFAWALGWLVVLRTLTRP